MTIKFNKNIYDPPAVAAAAGAFVDLAIFKIKATAKDVAVEIKSGNKKTDEGKIKDEFANYVLFLMNK
jgi:hypothetical protein